MFASLQASKLSTSELRLINFLWQYLSVRRAHANWGGTNMGIVRSGHFWQLGSIASLATETITECLILKLFPRGACPQTPGSS